MNKRAETMIFFSLHYPYHFTDSYLDEEINLLAKQFNKVIVITSNTFSTEKRTVPENTVVYRFNPNSNSKTRAKTFQLLLKSVFYKKLFQIVLDSDVAFNLYVIKELFAFYARAEATKEFLEEIIEQHAIDKNSLLIYTYWMVESTMAAALLKCKNSTIKIISKAHSQDVYFERSPVGYHPYRKFIFDHLNHLFFISVDARNYFIKRHHITREEQNRISIGRIGINGNYESFIPKTETRTLRIISVAYVQKIKRIDLIVEALALVSDLQIEWFHAGHSNQSESDFEQLKKYAVEKLSGNKNIAVTFLGKTGKAELFNLYEKKQFDVFLNVSETEGIPVSMMEAMSYSVPVIGTNVGGVAEIVSNGENGFLLSPYPDAYEVADAIKKFDALDGSVKNIYRKNAFTTWAKKFNAAKNNEQFLVKVMEVLNSQE